LSEEQPLSTQHLTHRAPKYRRRAPIAPTPPADLLARVEADLLVRGRAAHKAAKARRSCEALGFLPERSKPERYGERPPNWKKAKRKARERLRIAGGPAEPVTRRPVVLTRRRRFKLAAAPLRRPASAGVDLRSLLAPRSKLEPLPGHGDVEQRPAPGRPATPAELHFDRAVF
jgi:hypothetical protein